MRRYAAVSAVALATASMPAAAEEVAPLLAQACAGCHGQAGAGQGTTPKIAGLEREKFVEAWEAFRADARPATIMNRIARGYTDEEIAVLADYFASLH